jgi:hypothetical protein
LSKPAIVTEYIGSTLRATFVSSGATIGAGAYATLRDGSNTVVTSRAAVDSGNGHLYADLPLPNSGQWMVNEWCATINANTYRRFALVEVKAVEVD